MVYVCGQTRLRWRNQYSKKINLVLFKWSAGNSLFFAECRAVTKDNFQIIFIVLSRAWFLSKSSWLQNKWVADTFAIIPKGVPYIYHTVATVLNLQPRQQFIKMNQFIKMMMAVHCCSQIRPSVFAPLVHRKLCPMLHYFRFSYG